MTMGTFLLLCIMGVVALMVLSTVMGVLLHVFIWLVTAPFRILFKVVFGLGGALLGLLLAPFVLVVGALGLGVALIAALLSLLTPLLPLVLLGLFGWAIYRAGWKKPVPPPPPPPGFWS